jgi:hypothetical protein
VVRPVVLAARQLTRRRRPHALARRPRPPARSSASSVRAKRFFHWELEFPDVFTEKGAGFDAIVGNPPWEIRKPNSKEFFSDRDPLYRAYGKQEALLRQRELFGRPRVRAQVARPRRPSRTSATSSATRAEPFGDVEDDDRSTAPRRPRPPQGRGVAQAAQEVGRRARPKKTGYADPEHAFRHQGSADLNSYKLFVEQAHALFKSGGQLGLVTPSGLYTDKGAVDLRRLLLDRCQWRWLYGFENRNKLFDIHRSFKFAVTIAAEGGQDRRRFRRPSCATSSRTGPRPRARSLSRPSASTPSARRASQCSRSAASATSRC